jgi:predicted transcriptional regulator
LAAGDPNPPPGGVPRAIYDDLAALGEAQPSIVLVDASGSAAAAYEIFGRMRDALWQFEHRWVVAVDEDERATVLKPPADAFFDTIVALDDFSIEGLIQLIEKRDDTLSSRERMRIAAGAHGNPRAALRAINRALVHGLEPDEQWAERADALERASNLGRPHAMLMAELLDLGQASPSDEVLQHRLGLSRARITKLLRDLLDQGLVETGVERPDGPGRPRTIYRPAAGGA